MTSLSIIEIFKSIQGESSWAGLPCAFVRLAGCPLSCRWCDTPYARNGGRAMDLDQVVRAILDMGVGLAEVTGGEPLAQAGALELLTALCDQGLTVLLETNGCEDITPVDHRVRVIMDIKCPSSGMALRTLWSNLDALGEGDEVKLVLADRADYDYALAVVRRHGLERRCGLLISTVAGQIQPAQVVQWMLADGLRARFQLQLHKYIWGPDARGV